MKKLIIVGSDIIFNVNSVDYIKRVVGEEIGFINSIHLYSDYNELRQNISNSLSVSSQMIIVSSAKEFFNISKTLTILSKSSMTVTNNMLTASNASIVEEFNILIQVNNTLINLLKYENYNLETILLKKEPTMVSVNIFNTTLDALRLHISTCSVYNQLDITIKSNLSMWHTLIIKGEVNIYNEFIKWLHSEYKHDVIISDNINHFIVQTLSKRNQKLTIAESCTGGLIASELTKIPGVSKILNGSIVSYANSIKEKLLNVQKKTMIDYGVVSKEVVNEMLNGVLVLFESDYAIAVSGIAGPDGGTINKPVGTVVIGVKSPNNTKIYNLHFEGDRESVQKQSQMYAIMELSKEILKNSDKFLDFS